MGVCVVCGRLHRTMLYLLVVARAVGIILAARVVDDVVARQRRRRRGVAVRVAGATGCRDTGAVCARASVSFAGVREQEEDDEEEWQ